MSRAGYHAVLILLGWLLVGPAVAQSEQPGISYAQAVTETISWASGRTDAAFIGQTWNHIERSAFRYGINPEFALAVISAEAYYGQGISWARYNVWRMWEDDTGQKLTSYPLAFDDVDQSFSELRLILADSATMEEAFEKYWCGPEKDFNTESFPAFSEAVSKLWNALQPIATARHGEVNRYERSDVGDMWASTDLGGLDGYRTKLGSRPLTNSEVQSYPDVEASYVAKIRGFNSKVTEENALLITRSVLTYCEKTGYMVDPRLVLALLRQESNFKVRATSRVGALGLGQLMPATARSFGITDPFDPVQNLYGCIRYLEREMVRWSDYEGEAKLARVLASYNAGPGAVMKYNGVPPYKETQNFVKVVSSTYMQLVQ